jgi:hypothetical protein
MKRSPARNLLRGTPKLPRSGRCGEDVFDLEGNTATMCERDPFERGRKLRRPIGEDHRIVRTKTTRPFASRARLQHGLFSSGKEHHAAGAMLRHADHEWIGALSTAYPCGETIDDHAL